MFQIVRVTRISPWKFSLRTFFSRSGVGIDNLNLSREQYATKNAASIESFKKRFLDSVNDTKGQIYTEDLRNMILAATTDEDINGVIEGLRKYNASKLKFTEFHFGSPLMRLLYIHNKTDLAMKLFMDESLKEIFRDAGSALVLMNKLLEDQRYEDALKIFDYGCQRGFTTTTGRTFPSDVMMLAVETLYHQNTKQSLEKLKDILGKVREQEVEINPRTAALAALLALRQNEPSFAMEILGANRIQNLTTIRNIRAICYAELGRVDEAINMVHLMADQPPIGDDRRRVFPLVLEHIRKAVEKTNDADQKSRFEDLAKFVTKNNRLSPIDLFDFLNEPINRRSAVSQTRPGTQSKPNSSPRERENQVVPPRRSAPTGRRIDTTSTSPIPQHVRQGIIKK